ncbi:hypothetical protein GCM10027592_32560 [Spirosoma flavus]
MSTFTIDFPGTADQFTAKAGTAIKEKGGTFAGDASKGNFHLKTPAGAVEGTYEVQGNVAGSPTPISVTINKKPFFVSAHMIEEAIKGFL